METFEPNDLIDRKAEQELFAEMLADSPVARVLTISDGGGRGKSSLLRRLEYNCRRSKPPAAAVIIELDRLDPTPFGFVERVVKGLPTSKARASFARFNKVNDARRLKDVSAFERSGAEWPAALHLDGNVEVGVQEGGVSAGVYAERIELPARPAFTDEHEQLARQRCVEAFFEDLRAVCAAEPLVLFLDVWEKCDLGLRAWLDEELFSGCTFSEDVNLRPKFLAIVLAGRPHHPAKERYGLRTDKFRDLFESDEDYTQSVRSIRSLSYWEREHVREFMVLNGCEAPEDVDIDYLQVKLREGWNLLNALQAVHNIISSQS